ncbi:hypothetical protein [Flavobacterium sp. YJ01]|uniref:hypothetical protein n=1 Tax=unclassified Flavobacterium TaxID=196869 RepID=UPI0023E3BAE7|nr:hypothetical protein [Flavobacterium sp. YJ01]WET02870.1 hypothetical protein P0R33_00765 [Flavobacterium sp. YJ01]
MKKIGLLIVLLISLISCSNDDNDNTPTADYHGKWNLTSMSRNKNPSANSIDIMEWQESYIFSSSGKFSKTRIKDNKKTTVFGTYTVVETSEQTQLTLIYGAQNDIIGTCTGNLTENLYIIKTVGKLFSTWGICDGPLLSYDKSN